MDTSREIQVLLVEDDRYQAFLIGEQLKAAESASFRLEWADTAGKAEALLQARTYDVLLLDYFLGQSTGAELLDDLPGLTNRIPVIILTGRAERDIDFEALRRGASDFLSKDYITPVILERAIRYAVEQFRIRAALRESKERLEGLYHAVFEGILVHDGERVLHANPAFLAMLGGGAEDIIGTALNEVFGGVPVPTDAPESDGVNASREVEILNRRGERLFLEVRGRSHCFDGRPAFLLAVRDITAHKRIAAELKSMNEELEGRVALRTEELHRSNQELERFAQVIAHDIRTPLGAVYSYVQEVRENLEQDAADGDDLLKRHFLDRAMGTVEHLQALVRAVLDYSRISFRPPSMDVVDLNLVVRQVLIDMETELQHANAYVCFPPLPQVPGNHLLLCNLFRNLIHNAIKYRGDQPLSITMVVEDLERCWRFALHDNGLGFPPEESEDIFIVLHRGSNVSHQAGDGVGLAMCKRIVELHDGRIWADSRPGEGAGFFIILPKLTEGWSHKKECRGCTHEDYCSRR
jgi:PAS domain S-box-containing protein